MKKCLEISHAGGPWITEDQVIRDIAVGHGGMFYGEGPSASEARTHQIAFDLLGGSSRTPDEQAEAIEEDIRKRLNITGLAFRLWEVRPTSGSSEEG